MKIVLGSISKHKLEAVQRACEMMGWDAEITGVKARSGVNEQPFTLRETLRGARNRALGAKNEDPTAIAVGIESGVVWIRNDDLSIVCIDTAIIVAILPNGQSFIGTSTGIQFPTETTYTALRQGFDKVTVGSVIAKELGGDETDPHATLTEGRLPRSETLV